MTETEIEIDVDADAAKALVQSWEDAVDDGAMDAANALAVLAENAMRREAPEGAGKNPPSLRDSIDTKPEGRSKKKTVQPFKRTREGWLLVRAVVGQPSAPTYTDERPPPGPLLEWARAKLGDEQAGWAVRESIFQSGHESFPDPFVDRSMNEWENTVEQVAGDAVRDALGGNET